MTSPTIPVDTTTPPLTVHMMARAAFADPGVEAIRAKHEALIQASQEFAQRLYQAAQQQQAAEGGAGGPAGDAGASQPSDDDVADAEIVDEGEEKSA